MDSKCLASSWLDKIRRNGVQKKLKNPTIKVHDSIFHALFLFTVPEHGFSEPVSLGNQTTKFLSPTSKHIQNTVNQFLFPCFYLGLKHDRVD